MNIPSYALSAVVAVDNGNGVANGKPYSNGKANGQSTGPTTIRNTMKDGSSNGLLHQEEVDPCPVSAVCNTLCVVFVQSSSMYEISCDFLSIDCMPSSVIEWVCPCMLMLAVQVGSNLGGEGRNS